MKSKIVCRRTDEQITFL